MAWPTNTGSQAPMPPKKSPIMLGAAAEEAMATVLGEGVGAGEVGGRVVRGRVVGGWPGRVRGAVGADGAVGACPSAVFDSNPDSIAMTARAGLIRIIAQHPPKDIPVSIIGFDIFRAL